MFLGHFAVALAAKPRAQRESLGVLVLAAQLPDVLWPALVAAGIERVAIAPGITAVTPLRFDSYPISHSLLLVVVWGALLGAARAWRTRDLGRAVVLFALVVSHWVLDAVSHRPDMPLLPWGDARVGFGLWNSVPGTLLVEGALFGAGVAIYAMATRPSDRSGRLGLVGFLSLLVAIYLASVFGPPPPSPNAVAFSTLALVPLVFYLARWFDSHRGTA